MLQTGTSDLPTVVLTIAGSDSGGCAGLQADLRTFGALGVHGTTAVTAVTAQSTTGVVGVVALSAEFVVDQVRTVLEDLPVVAVKTGMLANPSIIEAVGRLAAEGRLPHLVVDPVLVSTSGHALMDEGGVEAYRAHLLPFAELVTPNLGEAALLSGRTRASLQSIEAMTEVARALLVFGHGSILVKGGHLGTGVGTLSPPAGSGHDLGSPDVLVGRDGEHLLSATRVSTRNDHGTGCSLSAAITTNLALGMSMFDAVRAAKQFVSRALLGAASWELGSGHGPIDHFGWGSRSR